MEIEHLTNKRIAKNNFTLIPSIILMIVAGFLVINVALGLFGVLAGLHGILLCWKN